MRLEVGAIIFITCSLFSVGFLKQKNDTCTEEASPNPIPILSETDEMTLITSKKHFTDLAKREKFLLMASYPSHCCLQFFQKYREIEKEVKLKSLPVKFVELHDAYMPHSIQDVKIFLILFEYGKQITSYGVLLKFAEDCIEKQNILRWLENEVSPENRQQEIQSSENGHHIIQFPENGQQEIQSPENGQQEIQSPENGQQKNQSSENGQQEIQSPENGQLEIQSHENAQQKNQSSENGQQEIQSSENGQQEIQSIAPVFKIQDGEIPSLKNDTFHFFLNSFKQVVIAFYSPLSKTNSQDMLLFREAFQELQKTKSPVRFSQVNVFKYPELFRGGKATFPVIAFYKNGDLLEKYTGVFDKMPVLEWVKKNAIL